MCHSIIYIFSQDAAVKQSRKQSDLTHKQSIVTQLQRIKMCKHKKNLIMLKVDEYIKQQKQRSKTKSCQVFLFIEHIWNQQANT